MAAGDIIFSQKTNEKCVIEQEDGSQQRAIHVAIGNTDINTEYLNVGQPFRLKVNQGLIQGHKSLDKYGVNPEITTTSDPEDLWEYGGVYTFDANGTAPIVSVVSDNALDTGILSVEGLDINGNEIVQEVTLTGNVRLALPTPLWRVYRMGNESDVGGDFVGNVYAYTTTGNVPGAGDIRAMINNGHGQTLMCIYTVPKGKVGFLHRGEIGVQLEGNAASLAEYAHCHYESRRYGKTFRVKKAVTCMVGGNAVYQDERSFPDVIPALTDIKLRAVIVTQTMGLWGTFDMLLIDEDLFPESYLTAIGQPGY